MNKATREEAHAALDSERQYQELVWNGNQLTIGEFLLSIEEYTQQARVHWSREPKPELVTLNFIRKIGGIALNALEQHGAPHRDLNEAYRWGPDSDVGVGPGEILPRT